MPDMRVTKLSAQEVNTLSAFLRHSDRPEGTMCFHELQGFLFAVSCAPELIRPSEWLPLISNDEDIGYADLNEAQEIMGLITTLYNEINTGVIERSDSMPSGCEFLADTAANIDESAAISQWSRGFTLGHNWLGELWSDCIPDDQNELSQELGACMMTLSFFSSRQMAEAFHLEAQPAERKTIEEFAETIRTLFPSALASYAHIGRTIAEVLAGEGEPD